MWCGVFSVTPHSWEPTEPEDLLPGTRTRAFPLRKRRNAEVRPTWRRRPTSRLLLPPLPPGVIPSLHPSAASLPLLTPQSVQHLHNTCCGPGTRPSALCAFIHLILAGSYGAGTTLTCTPQVKKLGTGQLVVLENGRAGVTEKYKTRTGTVRT